MRAVGIFLVAVLTAGVVRASGFGLYEMSTAGHALGGAVVGRAVDASANYYNPATLADITNITVTAGFVTQHPRTRIKVDGAPSTRMDSGLYALPHVNVAAPLPKGFVFGLGIYPEYGLGTSYERHWALANSSRETTVMSITVNPNVAYAITEDWSIAAGLRFLYFDFEQYSDPMPGKIGHHLFGNNGMKDFGWQVGTRYRLRDDFAVGAVYRSATTVGVEGRSVTSGLQHTRNHAETEMRLPQSITAGFNWDMTRTLHLGAALMWTQWSSIGTLDFNLGGKHTPCKLEWEDTFRVSVAPSWDFAEDWTWMGSYAFENDCCGGQDSTMLPAANRHLLATGVIWRYSANLEFSLSYGLIIMDGQTSQATGTDGRLHRYEPHRGLSHAVGLSVTYRF